MKINSIYKTLSAEAIKETMTRYHKTMKDISKDLFIPYRTIQNWCGGVSRPPIYVLRLIDEYYFTEFKRNEVNDDLEKASDLLHDGRIREAIEIIDNIYI